MPVLKLELLLVLHTGVIFFTCIFSELSIKDEVLILFNLQLMLSPCLLKFDLPGVRCRFKWMTCRPGTLSSCSPAGTGTVLVQLLSPEVDERFFADALKFVRFKLSLH